MGTVYRKQMIEGVERNGIIHNSSYFLVRLAVYEDGVVGCWHKSDLEAFRGDLARGWVVPSVPDGKTLSVHSLGAYPVVKARWTHDRDGFYRSIVECVRSLNPEMQNIYRQTEREAAKWKKHRVSWSASATPFKLLRPLGYSLADGLSTFLFYRDGGRVFLTSLTAYHDKTFHLEETGERDYSEAEIETLFSNGILFAEWKAEGPVTISGLGEAVLGAGLGGLTDKDKLAEVHELLLRAAGEPTAHERCRNAYFAYLVDPSDYNREALRAAYEAVPRHERIYLGDMDSRDTDYIRILEHPEQKREV